MPGQKAQEEKGTQARSILKVRNVVKELKVFVVQNGWSGGVCGDLASPVKKELKAWP